MEGTFRINGEEKKIIFSSASTLITLLRENGYTEVKEGCGEGACGACVILLDGKPVNSCQVFAASALEKEITPVRGLEISMIRIQYNPLLSMPEQSNADSARRAWSWRPTSF